MGIEMEGMLDTYLYYKEKETQPTTTALSNI